MPKFIFLALSLFGIAGCSDTSPAEQIRALIPAAASISNADFQSLATATNPSSTQIQSQSLSLILFSLDPFAEAKKNSAAATDFRFVGEQFPKPSELSKVMWQSKASGYATMIQPAFIDDFECRVTGSNAEGVVSFQAPGLYAGKVEFRAQLVERRWRIEEFRLPNYGLTTTRNADDVWKRSLLGNTSP